MIHKECERVGEGDDRRKKREKSSVEQISSKSVCGAIIQTQTWNTASSLKAKQTGPLKYLEKVGTRGNMMNEHNQLQSTTPSIGLT